MMTVQTVTLNLPSVLYERFQQRAAQSHRSIEIELLEAVATNAPTTDELPSDLAKVMASLAQLDDDTLRRAARSHFSPNEATELEQLHLKRQAEGLTQDESQRASGLTREYECVMLIRAQAMALLMQRGYDATDLVAPKLE